MTSTRRTVAVAAPALLLAAGARAPAPRRVVSLNPCLDAILVEVADRSQIAALSHFSRSPHDSTIAALARTFPQSYESAEEVLVLRPDLVLASRHSSPATRAALARFGAPEELFGVPATVEASLEQVARVARLVGHAERGAALTARIRAALAAAAPPAGARPLSALVFQPTGLVAGRGTLMDDMLRRTGFVNVAARYGVTSWGVVSLERLLADPPAVLLSDAPEPGAPAWAERVVTHPALAAVAGRMARGVFPERLLYCGGPALIDSARTLAAVRRRLEGRA